MFIWYVKDLLFKRLNKFPYKFFKKFFLKIFYRKYIGSMKENMIIAFQNLIIVLEEYNHIINIDEETSIKLSMKFRNIIYISNGKIQMKINIDELYWKAYFDIKIPLKKYVFTVKLNHTDEFINNIPEDIRTDVYNLLDFTFNYCFKKYIYKNSGISEN